MRKASRRGWLPLLTALVIHGSTCLAAGDPGGFPLRDHAPFAGILGLPERWPDGGEARLDLSWNIANHSLNRTAGAEFLRLDGETHTLAIRLQHRPASRLALGLELPWLAHGGGFLDGAIDAWHDAFGLSEGIRATSPRNDLQYVYGRADQELFRLDDATSGVGDVRGAAALRLNRPYPDARMQLDLMLNVKLPTGDADRLTGSGGTDVAAGLRLGAPIPDAGRLGGWLAAGLLWPGDVDLPVPSVSGRVFYYDATLSWRAWQRLQLLLQVQGHAGAYQSGLKSLGGSAAQLGGGVVWQLTDRYALRLGVFEDIAVDTTPDFSTDLSLLVRPRR